MFCLKKTIFLTAVFCLALFGAAGEGKAAVPAFPEAQGGGAESIGGRGGRVIYVTNLNNEGLGSLREAMESTGPRIVVFKVGGIINLQKTVANPDGFIYVTNPYLTVAGQTAPGGGITVRGQIAIGTHDVILRFISIRLGKASRSDFLYNGAIAGWSGVYNLMVDHISASWANDDTLSIYTGSVPAHDNTFSWNLDAEGLRDETYLPLGSDPSKGMLFGSDINPYSYNIAVHHNALMHFTNRFPKADIQDIVIANNLFYHGTYFMTQLHGGIKADLIGNVYKRIPPPDQKQTEVLALSCDTYGGTYNCNGTLPAHDLPGNPSIYITGNIGPTQPDPNGDDWRMVNNGTRPASWRRLTPLPQVKYPITLHSASVLEDIVLNDVGNSRRLDENGNWVNRRDSVDTRLINEYRTNTGILPYNENEVGGFPVIASGIPYTDSDNDGMPNAYEISHGFNPNVADNNGDADGDGYTNVEEFLNGGGEIPVPAPVIDTQIPTITIDCPTGVPTYSSTSINLSGTATDNVGVKEVWVKVGTGGTWLPAVLTSSNATFTNWSISVVIIAAGLNTVYAKVVDTSNNDNIPLAGESPVFIQVTYSNTLPPPPAVVCTKTVAKDGTGDFTTIQAAADVAVAGDTVCVKAGTYNERVTIKNSGTLGNWISFAAYPGHTVTIDGTGIKIGSFLEGLIYLKGKSYIRISGFRIINSTAAGIMVMHNYDGLTWSNIIIEKNYIYNTHSSGIQAIGPGNNIIVSENEIELCANVAPPTWAQECLSLTRGWGPIDTFEIKNNNIHHNGGWYVPTMWRGGEGIDAKDGVKNGKIYSNEVHHLGREWDTNVAIYVDGASYNAEDIEIYNNVVHDNKGHGIVVGRERQGYVKNIRVYNNIVYNNVRLGIFVAKHPDGTGLMNNISIIIGLTRLPNN